MKYLVLSKNQKVLVKFFYEGEHGEYGEFKMEFKKETFDELRPEDTIGVRGDVEVYTNDNTGALDLVKAFAKAMRINILEQKIWKTQM